MTGLDADLAITNVSVVDVLDGAVHADQTVLVSGDRIAAVGPADSTRPAKSARVVDARGKYLIPGLWDMHARAERASRFWQQAGIPVIGHVPSSVTAIEASEAGQRSFEHPTDLLMACIPNARELAVAHLRAVTEHGGASEAARAAEGRLAASTATRVCAGYQMRSRNGGDRAAG